MGAAINRHEVTDVYFYKDIVAVSTETNDAVADDHRFRYESFKLVTTGGNALSCSVNGDIDTQNTINTMRRFIRAKKSHRQKSWVKRLCSGIFSSRHFRYS